MAKVPGAGSNEVLVVIPARYGSSRFPGKALADLEGAPLIVRVAEAAAAIGLADDIVVATDDERIRAAVLEAGHRCEMTGEHATGTDRIGEVVARYEAGIVVNLQGDEPLLDALDVVRLIAALQNEPDLDLVTCAHRFASPEDWRDPNQVKVVRGTDGMALYFSRAPIPGTFSGTEVLAWKQAMRHVGLYAFRREALMRFLDLARSPLEITEGLEQLRALENGMRIMVLEIDAAPVGVDTPADLEQVRELWRQRS